SAVADGGQLQTQPRSCQALAAAPHASGSLGPVTRVRLSVRLLAVQERKHGQNPPAIVCGGRPSARVPPVAAYRACTCWDRTRMPTRVALSYHPGGLQALVGVRGRHPDVDDSDIRGPLESVTITCPVGHYFIA